MAAAAEKLRDGQRWIGAASVVAGLVSWQVSGAWLAAPELLPTPLVVLDEGVEMIASGELAAAVAVSLMRAFGGYLIGVAAGILTGLLLGEVAFLRQTFRPVFEFLNGIPPIALVPLLIMWLGIGEQPKIVLVAYIVWVVVAVGTYTGVAETPAIRRKAGLFFGISRAAMFLRIILPSAIPHVLGAMRIAIGFAFIALVSAELIAADTGVGAVIMDSRFALQTPRMIVGLLTLGILGATCQLAFDFATQRASRFAQFRKQ